MSRKEAGDRFAVASGFAVVTSWLAQAVDLPRAIGIGVGAVILGLLLY